MGKLTVKESLEITKNIKDLKRKELTWSKIAELTNQKYGTNFTKEQVRDRARKSQNKKINNNITEYEEHFSNGEIEVNKAVFLNGVPKTAEDVLNLLGYEKDCWQVKNWKVGEWDTSMKDADGNPTVSTNRTIKATLAPKEDELTMEDAIDVYKNYIETIDIKFNGKVKETKGLDQNKLKELPGIELHLGKMSWSGDTGQDYDKDIATERFRVIVEGIVNQQKIEKASECLYCVGNDFFNSDTVDYTTTKGTPQTNDLRWKKMFNLGLDLNVFLISKLMDNFDKVNIRLVSGNHDEMSSFYLYIALQQYFRFEDKVEFSDNYKNVQCYLWGDCGIYYSHGDANLKRLIKSIPAEFYKEWGMTKYRELHLGHLHKEVVVDDESGLITRRVGSPTGTDQWHYESRFIGATQKYQTFLWDKTQGLKSIMYTNF